MSTHPTRLVLAAAVAFASVILCSCQMGPGALKVSSSHYSDAIRVATSNEILVNLVRLRYRDLPVFLAVSSISTQFEFGASADVSGTIPEGGRASILGLGAGVNYAEKPTLTFGIMGGEDFQKRMLTPIKSSAIALLAESGWRGERVFGMMVEGMNGLENAPTASGPTPMLAPDTREFDEALRSMRELSRLDLMRLDTETSFELISDPIPADQIEAADFVDAAKAGLEFFRTEDGKGYQLTLERRRLVMWLAPEAESTAEFARLRELLRLRDGQLRYEFMDFDDLELEPFRKGQRTKHIALDTRSLVGTIYTLSHAVQAPPEHVEAGLVTRTVDANGEEFDWAEALSELIVIRWSAEEPAGAAVAVQHRGYWFYIAENDLNSMSTFNLLSQLFSLQAGDVDQTAPVLTLPVGG